MNDIAPLNVGDDEESPLTWRETMVTNLVAKGYTNKGIGERLNVAESTVKNHVSSAMGKLGFVNRVQLAAWWTGLEALRAARGNRD